MIILLNLKILVFTVYGNASYRTGSLQYWDGLLQNTNSCTKACYAHHPEQERFDGLCPNRLIWPRVNKICLIYIGILCVFYLIHCMFSGSGKTAAFLMPILNQIFEDGPPKNVPVVCSLSVCYFCILSFYF